MKRRAAVLVLLSCGWMLCCVECSGADAVKTIEVDWTKIERVSQTVPTLQVVVNPPLRRGSAIHDRVFESLKDLQCDLVRYVPWLPYPRLGVAELEPPHDDKTFWDFSLIDPMTEDFLNAIQGHSVILNFSTIPQWMFKTPKPITYPTDPDQVFWDYTQGTELRDPSMKELGDYYARLVSWYTRGGFVDELGQRHESGHHFKVAYWEILNEVDFEHAMTPQQYTVRYDAIVEAIRKAAPEMKFVGMALAAPSQEPRFFEYFLNPKHHKPGIPLDMISYHFYATPGADQSPEVLQFTFVEQANHFLDTVRYVENIRQRLAPHTRTTIDEIGSILPGDPAGPDADSLPKSYWNLSGATYAYVFSELTKMGIDVAGESQLVGYPTQFPSVSMVDWNTGQPNARYWVLKLLHDHFGPGDKLVATSSRAPGVYAQAFVTREGKRKVLLINQRDHDAEFSLAGASRAELHYVDQTTAFHPPATALVESDTVALRGYSVAVLTLGQ